MAPLSQITWGLFPVLTRDGKVPFRPPAGCSSPPGTGGVPQPVGCQMGHLNRMSLSRVLWRYNSGSVDAALMRTCSQRDAGEKQRTGPCSSCAELLCRVSPAAYSTCPSLTRALVPRASWNCQLTELCRDFKAQHVRYLSISVK